MPKCNTVSPRYVVRFDITVDGGWEVYDTQLQMAVFGSDSRQDCENHAGQLALWEAEHAE